MPMRKRKEVQKMPRRITAAGGWLALALCLAPPVGAGILPEQLGQERRGPVQAVIPSDPVLAEYGIEAAEQADYGPMSVVAWRFRDSTGAMAAFQYKRPPESKPDKLDKQAAVAGHLILAAHGNYLYQFVDGVPTEEQYKQLQFAVPRIEQSSLPIIGTYLPPEGLIANSERYVGGPVALEKFMPGVAPSLVAFHLSAEGQYGRYQGREGKVMDLAIFSYPTPNMARERSEAFGKLAGTVVKRAGSLVILALNSPNPDDAERLLAKIQQQASLTWNENPKENIVKSTGDMILTIMQLAGVVILFCVLSGLAFGGIRVMRRKIGRGDADDGMITLHLQGK